MVKVAFTQNLARHVDSSTREVEGGSIGEVLERVFAVTPQLRGYIVDDQGAIRKHVAVFINGEPINDRTLLSDVVNDGAEVFVAQSLSGG